MQVRPGCAFVLEWNLPFQNPGSATVKPSIVVPVGTVFANSVIYNDVYNLNNIIMLIR